MLNLKSITSIAQRPAVAGAARGIVFDGRSAVTVANARDQSAPWWAGVPLAQAQVQGAAVAVPVDTVRQHLLRSRHLVVAPDHLHNGQGLRTEWAVDKGCDAALAMLPAMPDGAPDVECELALDDLDRVVIAAATQDIRHYLTGVLLDFDAGAIVATDGKRLHVVRDVLPVRAGLSMIVPRAAAYWLLRSTDERATVRCWGLGTPHARVLLAASDGFVFAHGVDGRFPEWQRVVGVPSKAGARFSVDSQALSAAVESMGKLHALETGKPAGLVCLDPATGRVWAGSGPHFTAVAMEVRQPAAAGVWTYLGALQLQDLADCVGEGAHWALPGTPMQGAVHVTDGAFTGVVSVWQLNDRPSERKEAAPVEPEPAPEPCAAAVGAMADQLRGKVVALPQHRKGRKVKLLH